jgi:hypothetical protein
MKRLIIIFLLAFSLYSTVYGQDTRVVLITLDGFRWEELFGGADTKLISNKMYMDNNEDNVKDLNALFNRPTGKERRETLLPFIWTTVKNKGTLIGNRWDGCKMNVANKMYFSYPGYNELLCGFPDDANVHSNDTIYNPNVNILEIANNTPEYKGRVLAFCSWDCFPYILNVKRSKLEVNAGYMHTLSPCPTKMELFLNTIEDENPRHWRDERFDVYTFHYGLEAMKTRKPKFIYFAFDETDDFSHDGRYDQYLKSAHRADMFIKELWEYTQSDSFYRNKTTFIITCDHGRGNGETRPDDWKGHGYDIKNSDQTWVIAFGKGVPAHGEVKKDCQYYTKQIAPTIASILKILFNPKNDNAGKKIVF